MPGGGAWAAPDEASSGLRGAACGGAQRRSRRAGCLRRPRSAEAAAEARANQERQCGRRRSGHGRGRPAACPRPWRRLGLGVARGPARVASGAGYGEVGRRLGPGRPAAGRLQGTEQPQEPSAGEDDEKPEVVKRKPKKKKWRSRLEDLSVGQTLAGRVFFISDEAVWIDIGASWRHARCCGRVLAPREEALRSLQAKQNVTATVEKVEDGRFWVSVAGLPKVPLVKDMEVGQSLQGRVAHKSRRGVMIDVGSDRNAYVWAPKKMAFEMLQNNEIVSTTVEKVDGDTVFVSVDGLPVIRSVEDLRVGETLDGVVAFKSVENGVYVDIGLPRTARVFAPRLTALSMLKANALVSATVEKVTEHRGVLTTWVSVAGVPKPQKASEDLEAGETFEGTVVYKAREGVYVDIGCELLPRVFAPIRQSLDTLEVNQTVTATIEKIPDSKALWVSVAGLPKLRLMKDLREGEQLEGIVVNRTKDGVFLDIGTLTRQARVLAPRSKAFEKLQFGTVVRATVERIRPKYILVSVAGLPRLKLIEDFQKGQVVDGYVAMKISTGVLVNIGCEQLAFLAAPTEEAFMLEPNEELKGLRVLSVDVEAAQVALSYDGLSDLVAPRLARRGPPMPPLPMPAGGGQSPPRRQRTPAPTPRAPPPQAAPARPQPPAAEGGLGGGAGGERARKGEAVGRRGDGHDGRAAEGDVPGGGACGFGHEGGPCEAADAIYSGIDTERRIVELEGELRAAKSADDFLECHRISTELARLSASLEAARPQKPRDAPGEHRARRRPAGAARGPRRARLGRPQSPSPRRPQSPSPRTRSRTTSRWARR
ncbi:unnamed protein product [Prorocentrum cordatum]|uniref:S1 motif domain-containing protein n=1 Tax=Prorocentrum cordatum TaxID=2364126 RepID=A0ABN9X242_9DINO|nr:unnamed protein product [Polarella glacialis]